VRRAHDERLLRSSLAWSGKAPARLSAKNCRCSSTKGVIKKAFEDSAVSEAPVPSESEAQTSLTASTATTILRSALEVYREMATALVIKDAATESDSSRPSTAKDEKDALTIRVLTIRGESSPGPEPAKAAEPKPILEEDKKVSAETICVTASPSKKPWGKNKTRKGDLQVAVVDDLKVKEQPTGPALISAPESGFEKKDAVVDEPKVEQQPAKPAPVLAAVPAPTLAPVPTLIFAPVPASMLVPAPRRFFHQCPPRSLHQSPRQFLVLLAVRCL